MSKKACLVVLSGGQDSTTCAFWARQYFQEVHCVTFDYGQLHKVEIEAAKKIADLIDSASHEIVKVGPILAGTSPLTNSLEQLEQYENWQSLPGGLEKTFVPGRNMLFLTLAANRAYCLGVQDVVTGVCQEDFGGYPDCRRTFIDAIEESVKEGFCTDATDPFSAFNIHTPLMDLSKAESIHFAMHIPGCYQALCWTHTSYDGQYPPTGRDHATLLRAKGFEQAGVPDPLVARAWAEGLMDLPTTTNYDVLRSAQFEAGGHTLAEAVGAA